MAGEDLILPNQGVFTENIDLIDIQNITIDTTRPVAEKRKSYYRQIVNPECFRCGDITVRVSFMKNGPTLRDRLQQYLLSGQSMELTTT